MSSPLPSGSSSIVSLIVLLVVWPFLDACSSAPKGGADGGSVDSGAADAGADAGPDGGGGDPDGRTEAEFRAAFAEGVQQWLGTNYTAGGTDASGGIDGAATVWTTLQGLGYAVPPAPADGLVERYYPKDGSQWGFDYTLDLGVAADTLTAHDFSALEPGDLIALDYDFDWVWDHVAVYLGAFQGMTHAAFTASDFHDTCVIADLDDDNNALAQDIVWSNPTARRLNYAAIEATYTAP